MGCFSLEINFSYLPGHQERQGYDLNRWAVSSAVPAQPHAIATGCHSHHRVLLSFHPN